MSPESPIEAKSNNLEVPRHPGESSSSGKLGDAIKRALKKNESPALEDTIAKRSFRKEGEPLESASIGRENTGEESGTTESSVEKTEPKLTPEKPEKSQSTLSELAKETKEGGDLFGFGKMAFEEEIDNLDKNDPARTLISTSNLPYALKRKVLKSYMESKNIPKLSEEGRRQKLRGHILEMEEEEQKRKKEAARDTLNSKTEATNTKENKIESQAVSESNEPTTSKDAGVEQGFETERRYTGDLGQVMEAIDLAGEILESQSLRHERPEIANEIQILKENLFDDNNTHPDTRSRLITLLTLQVGKENKPNLEKIIKMAKIKAVAEMLKDDDKFAELRKQAIEQSTEDYPNAA